MIIKLPDTECEHVWVVNGIDWAIDCEDYYAVLDAMPEKEAATVIRVVEEPIYLSADTELRHAFADHYFHHCPGALYDFLKLPESKTIPANGIAEEDIADYLSDKYGYCINSIDTIALVKHSKDKADTKSPSKAKSSKRLRI